MDTAHRRFAWFAWAVLAFNIPVILWGAYVRVSYSGDGCGDNWPFCNGQALPQHMAHSTVIEFTHRMMTSVDSFLILILVSSAFWLYPKRHAVRRYAVASLVFLVIEALLGAGLVLFRKVAHDHSAGRVWSLSAHLVNTLLLLAVLTITAWLASHRRAFFQLRESRSGWLWSALIAALVSITGAVTSLGDMLFPSGSLLEGVQRDLSRASPLLLRLRIAHPVIAVAGALFIIWTALTSVRFGSDGERRAGIRLIFLCALQLVIGAVNLTLLAPIWMQLIHLLMADLLWIALVYAGAESIAHRSLAERGISFNLSSRQPAASKPA